MPKQWLRQQLPDTHRLHQQLWARAPHWSSGWLKRLFDDPALWHLNRRSVAGGVAVGLFVSWIPIPLQMVVAAILAALLRVHVPVSAVMVWFTNPLTFAPLLYVAWFVGSTVLGMHTDHDPLSLSIYDVVGIARAAWPVVLAGSLFCALVSAVLGWALTHIAWRIISIRRWKRRHARALRDGDATDRQPLKPLNRRPVD